MDFTDKRILVTGSSRGIGFGVAKAFLDAGARVAINGRSEESVGVAIEKLGGDERLVPAPGDIGTVAGCEQVVKAATDAFGGLDILVNSAGLFAEKAIADCDEAMWDGLMDVNLKGTFFCCRAALPALRESKGSIVNIGSDAGMMGVPGLVVYCASKGGIVNMTRAIALEEAPDVRANCVCPGYVDTDMIRRDLIETSDDPAATERSMIDYAPLKRMGTPAEISHAILYLASAEAGNITGAALAIDGGSTAGH
jgi:NAD(P)-dependent dehydrogenase (short-subunit alcohol dehydrogenase family)